MIAVPRQAMPSLGASFDEAPPRSRGPIEKAACRPQRGPWAEDAALRPTAAEVRRLTTARNRHLSGTRTVKRQASKSCQPASPCRCVASLEFWVGGNFRLRTADSVRKVRTGLPGFSMKILPRNIVRNRMFALAIIAGAIAFIVYDLAYDAFLEGEFPSFHFFIELLVFIGASAVLLIGIRDLLQLRRQLSREERRNDMYSRALAKSIDLQLDAWGMSPSERDVAWFIIKGYRFSEIARMRGVKETTSRLQATSVYAKAGVRGRSEFVAEIIQSLLERLPEDAGHRDRSFPAEPDPQ